MSQTPTNSHSVAEELSALMDGELDTSASVQRVCALWRDDPEMRARWHGYQLISDVMRSEDLVSNAEHDGLFIEKLRQRLATEPVVLAPTAAASGRSSFRQKRWIAPAAAAAGFVMVAGVLVVTQFSGALPSFSGSQPDGHLVKQQSASPLQAVAGNAVAPASAADSSTDPQVVVLNGQLIRDARLDQYLAAHKKFGGSSASGAPSGFLRNAAASDDVAR